MKLQRLRGCGGETSLIHGWGKKKMSICNSCLLAGGCVCSGGASVTLLSWGPTVGITRGKDIFPDVSTWR